MEYEEKVSLMKECIEQYVSPIYISGKIAYPDSSRITIISALIKKEELIILNNEYPEWLKKVFHNAGMKNNLLLINDFDKINLEEQNKFIDIICKNYCSSVKLPDNLKIIINSSKPCNLNSNIKEVIQYVG